MGKITDNVAGFLDGTGSVIDQVGDFVPVVGNLLDGVPAGALKAGAGIVRAGGAVSDGKSTKEAGVEVTVGFTRGLVAAVPFAEKAKFAGVNLEDMAEKEVRNRIAPSDCPNVQSPSEDLGLRK